MNCFICGSPTEYYFAKTYTEAPFDDFMKNIGEVRFRRCCGCGFVFSETHAGLDDGRWERLNHQFHHHLEDPAKRKLNAQPPYAEQALMLAMLSRNGWVDLSGALDYAAGYGTLSRLLAEYFQIELPLYDPYVTGGAGGSYLNPEPGRVFSTVINSAMFEHIRDRRDLNLVNERVAPGGCLVLHTVVCENVPADPDWFYIRIPVHSAFHTNESMRQLMQQWGYRSSLYCPQGKSWVLYKDPPMGIEAGLSRLNEQLQSTWFIYQEGFVDYWKGF